MTCKANLLMSHIDSLITDHFESAGVIFELKRNHPQFYLNRLFGDKSNGLELLICLTPSEDKAQIMPGRISHSPYRVAIRLIQKVELQDPEAGLDSLQEQVHQLRLALMPRYDEHNPFQGFCSVTEQPFEAHPVKYPQPEPNINAISALMILEIPFTENT